MTNLNELNKKSLLELAQQKGLEVKKSFTKTQIIEIIENAQNEQKTQEEEINMNKEVIVEVNEEVVEKNEVVVITIEENPSQDENVNNEEDVNMIVEYNEFLITQNCEFSLIENTFLINGPKKKICIKIDVDTNFGHVFTVLNKKEFKRENARNILTLKSLKAIKSYTISNLK